MIFMGELLVSGRVDPSEHVLSPNLHVMSTPDELNGKNQLTYYLNTASALVKQQLGGVLGRPRNLGSMVSNWVRTYV